MLIYKFSKIIIKKLIRKIISPEQNCSKKEEKQRADTLISIIHLTLNVSIFIVGFLMILQQLGVGIALLLTGVGIFGLAIDFGAQHLVKDNN